MNQFHPLAGGPAAGPPAAGGVSASSPSPAPAPAFRVTGMALAAPVQARGPGARRRALRPTGPPTDFPPAPLEPDFRVALEQGSFLVPVEWDALAAIRARFRRAREQTPAVLTVTTTMDCNLGCYYCYEDR